MENNNEMNSIGSYLRQSLWQLKNCRSKWEIVNLAKIAVNFHGDDPIVQRDFPEFLENLERCETLADAYMYYVNRVLADVDMRAVK